MLNYISKKLRLIRPNALEATLINCELPLDMGDADDSHKQRALNPQKTGTYDTY